MPGSGKSALLQRIAADARERGYVVQAVAQKLSSGARFDEVARRLSSVRRRTLVVVDDWDALAVEEPQLVDRIEQASGPLVLLVGSRVRPRACLLESALFPDRFRVIELAGLREADAIALLRERQVAPAEARRIHRACDGQPAAMLLMATSASLIATTTTRGSHRQVDKSPRDPVRMLLGQVRDASQIAALELVSLMGNLNERELMLGLDLDPPRARGVFEWLRALTLVQPTASGLEVHHLVRSAVVADLLQRDPVRARARVAKILRVIEESLAWSGIPRARALEQLRELVASAPQDVALARMFERGALRVAQAGERDLPGAFALIEQLEGPDARATLERYVRHDPASITVVHGRTGVDGVMVRVEWRGTAVPQPFAEAVTRRLVDTLARSQELEPHKLLRMTRFFHARLHGQMPCAELGALGAAITRRTLETSEPFLTVQILDEAAVAGWLALIRTMGFVVRDDASVEMNGRRYVPCVADFADLGNVFLGVARRAWGLDVEGATSQAAEADPLRPPVPPSVDVEAAVVRALGHLRDLVWLGGSPLGEWLFPDEAHGARAAHLQQWLVEAIASTETMRNGVQVARALHASFDASRSLDEAATVARMGVSTLKRYRKFGVVRVAELALRHVEARPPAYRGIAQSLVGQDGTGAPRGPGADRKTT
jgi:hypothetical protein